MMNALTDIIETNKTILSKSVKLALRNWPIVFTGIVYTVILLLLWKIAFMFWILAGILVAIVQSALISNYLYLIENIILYDRITLDDFKKGFMVYIWKIYGVLLVLWFVNYGAGLFLGFIFNIRLGFISLWSLVILAGFLLLNSIPEVLYQKHYNVGESFGYSFDFIKENWLDWFVPNGLFWIILYLTVGSVLPSSLVGGINMLSLSLKGVIVYFIGQWIFSFMMIYRGLLFQVLSSTTRRKRVFMRNNR